MSKPLKTECFDCSEGIPLSYDPLFAAAGKHSFFLTKGWFSIVEEKARPEGSRPLYVGILNEAGKPVGLVPLFIFSTGDKLTSIRSMTSVYTQDFRPVLCRNDNDLASALGGFVNWLMGPESRWNTLDFKFLTAGDIAVDMFQDILSKHRVLVKRYAQYENWHYPVSVENGDAYIAGLSKKLRGDIRRQQKKLADDNRLVIEISTGNDNFDRLLQDFRHVYEHSWKGLESSPDFVPSVACWCAKNGSARVAVAYIDGQPAGAQFWIVHAGCAYIYKIAYVETFKNTSVGSILTAFLAKYVIDHDHVEKIDFGVGSEPYKQRWMSHCNQKHGLVVYNCHTAKGMLLGIKQKLADLVSRLLKQRGE